MSKRPICPACGEPAELTQTRWGPRYDCCGLWSWGKHPLVCGKTHAARTAAHKAFDGLWKSGRIRRGDAYQRLAAELGIEVRACHMKLMDATLAAQVPAAVRRIWATLAS